MNWRSLRSDFTRAACLACLGTAASAQTFIVDDDGGPGVHYTNLTQAVAEAPSGAVLRVRAGLYTGFFFSNKGLSIIGDDSSTVTVNSAGLLRIGPLQPGQDLLMTDMTFRGIGPGSAGIEIVGAAGQVVLDSLAIELSGATGLVVESCPNAHVLRCNVQPSPSTATACCIAAVEIRQSSVQVSDCMIEGREGFSISSPNGVPGQIGLDILGGSKVFMTQTTVLGGNGQTVTCPITCGFGWPGGNGVQCVGSILVAESCVIRGGQGGSASYSAPPGWGVFADASNIELQGFDLLTEPCWTLECLLFPPTNTVATVNGSTLLQDPDSDPALAQAGPVQPGATTDITLTAQAGSAAALLLGFDAIYFPLTQSFATGALFVLPAFSANVGLVPASGSLQLPLPISPFWPRDVAIHGQFATLEPTSGRVWASNSFLLLAKS